ncbi:hypothetical protein Pcinc_010740 [Petrolisthes cinctipes]|uniref:Uncharacterized protein n=1 Tax=Petrolisthes cinctipes TaxID=88211 RepID=A0AAE1G252_PETCI|nr:hypothetical protein Pcinc_010740 [Petrolisthes cinctipes]
MIDSPHTTYTHHYPSSPLTTYTHHYPSSPLTTYTHHYPSSPLTTYTHHYPSSPLTTYTHLLSFTFSPRHLQYPTKPRLNGGTPKSSKWLECTIPLSPFLSSSLILG